LNVLKSSENGIREEIEDVDTTLGFHSGADLAVDRRVGRRSFVK
jgi:hypothetical protein